MMTAAKRGRVRRPQGRAPVGRPMKYAHIIESLNDEALYSPATIARFAGANGLLPIVEKAQQRVRVAMGRLRAYHDFPKHGDGTIRLSGQCPKPGWFGRRWKLLILGEDVRRSNQEP